MIKQLRLKIIAVVLGTLLSVFAAVLLVLNISVYQTSAQLTDDFMASVVENDGFMFPARDDSQERAAPPPERHDRRGTSPFAQPEMRSGRFFYAKADSSDSVFEMNLSMMFDFSADDAIEYISAALSNAQKKGSIGNYSYIVAAKEYGHIIVFAERSIEMRLLDQLTKTSLWVAGIAGIILICFTALLSKWMVSPIKKAFDNQRRFVSDASHELKTPLTIISANADVLQNEIGFRRQISSIKTQADRMNGLVHDLLTLAKTDEGRTEITMSEFNLSGAILSTALEFESLAFEEGKQYSYEIEEGVSFIGGEKYIKQLAGILIDNAIRYSDANGTIKISLQKDGSRARISVYNTGIGVPDIERTRIFERFYRSDESRARETGGYGVGLSIARAIAEMHRGKITVSGKHGEWVQFDVVI